MKNTTQYHTAYRSLLAAFAGAIGLALATPTSAAIILFKVYDDTTGFDNSVDRNANGNPISATGPDDYLGFKADVATAFDNGMGGVWRTNRGGTGPTQDPGAPALNVPFTSQTLSFAGGTKTIDVSFNTNMRLESYGTATAISGYDMLDTSPGSATQPWTMTLGPVVGGDPNERVVRLAITQLSRLVNTVGMTVTLDDSSTLSLTSISVPAGNALYDTFFAFSAPTGRYITSLAVTHTSQAPWDDIGIITAVIPEPSTAALVGIAALGLVIARRRRSA